MLGAAWLTQFQSPGPKGQQLFDNASGSFVVPAGVTEICVVAVGRGGAARSFPSGESGFTLGGAGGNLRYANAIPVTPLETLDVTISDAGSYLARAGAQIVTAWGQGTPGTQTGAGEGFGFNGSAGTAADWEESSDGITGGGAGGYASAGAVAPSQNGRGGGGVSLLGGTVGGTSNSNFGPKPAGQGADYGGGVGSAGSGQGKGGVRIIWGAGRAFPNTNTGDV